MGINQRYSEVFSLFSVTNFKVVQLCLHSLTVDPALSKALLKWRELSKIRIFPCISYCLRKI